jgi:hypothetical protein
MTIRGETIILSAVLVIFLFSLKVVYGGIPTTLEEVQNEEAKSQTDRTQLESYIVNHNISMKINEENRTALNLSSDWIPLENLMQYAETDLLQVSVREHMQRCGAENEGNKINYTISNTDIQFPIRSGIC